eukprot:GGOE01002412.1.p1 GENE.GGOE01002412.1~~GGOE01002412.1.p1  ORF type:complete len:769 (-),score=170.35 GGOE01002412.1:305-2611(-)
MAAQTPNMSIEAFLEQHLEAITDADPKTLTPYILALIHKPKKYCMEQLRDFLHEETEPFVEKLFEFLAKQSNHRKGKEERERKRDRSEKEGKRRRHTDEERESKRAKKERQGESGRHGKSSKVAKFHVESGASSRDPPPPYHISEADARQAHANQRQHGGSAERGRGAEEEDFSVPLNPLENSLNALLMSADGRAAVPNHVVVDPNQRNVQMVMPVAPRGPLNNQVLQPGPAGPQLHFPPAMMPMAPQAPHPLQFAPGFVPHGFASPGFGPGSGPHFLAGTHPAHPHLMQGPQPGMALHSLPMAIPPQHPGLIGVPLSQGMGPPMQRPFHQPPRRDDHFHPRLGGGGTGGEMVPKNTILVRSVPAEVNTIARLSAHFELFGMVLNVRVQPATRTALVTFRSSQEAYNALNCPDAVCGNRFISTELAHPSAGGGGDSGTPERMVRHRRSDSGPLRLGRGEEEEASHSGKNQRAEIERLKVLTQRRAEAVEKLRQLEQRGQPPAASTGTPTNQPPATVHPPSGPSRTVLPTEKARQLSTLLERKKATVEAALAKCKQRFAEVEKNPTACSAAEKQALLQNIKELGQALRAVVDQGRRLAPISPIRRPSLGGMDGEPRSGGGAGHLTPIPDMGAEEDDDDQATSDLFVRPFPAEWVDNEEDVKFHFATTTMTTPLSVEFHPQYVRVVFPGKRTAMRALESGGEWNDAPLGLHLAEPREAGPVHVQETVATAATDAGSTKGGDVLGDSAPGAAEPPRIEADDDDDPDRSWKR